MTENNPANMSNEDLENDMKNAENNSDEQGQGESHSTASEGTLKTEQKQSMDMGVSYDESKEQDLDDLVHQQAEVASGTMPDPETIALDDDPETDDTDKLSS